MKSGVTKTIDKLEQVAKNIADLATLRLMVGVPSDKAPREHTSITNAALAYIHENGAPDAGIPARPFLRPTIKENQQVIEAAMRSTADSALSGKVDAVRKSLTALGLKMQAAVRRKITQGPFEPLKPSTLAARRRRGRTGTKPLIDTGQLRNAINFVIRKV